MRKRKRHCPGFVDERVKCNARRLFSAAMEKGSSLVSVVSHPGIIPRYTWEGGGGPLEGEMEHEAREARPIGAQGAFASNSMHYTYTPPRLLRRPLNPSDTHPLLANRGTLSSKRTSIRSLRCKTAFFRRATRFDPRNLSAVEKVTFFLTRLRVRLIRISLERRVKNQRSLSRIFAKRKRYDVRFLDVFL